MIESGKLRYLVNIDDLVSEQDSRGNDIETPTRFLTGIWADIRPGKGREFYAAQQEQSEIQTEIEIRYHAGITARMRVEYNGVNYGIVGRPPDIERRGENMVLYCTAGVREEG